MKDILRIGEFSKLNNIPIRTLRFYDQIGLLKPYQVDPETNYRGYQIEQSSLVDAIQYLRQLDFSLEEIKEILSDIENSHLHKLIIDKYQQLIEEQKRIQKQLREIEIYQSGALLYQRKSHSEHLEIQTFPERSLYRFQIDSNIYQMSTEEYELHLRCFKQEIMQYNPFFNHFSRVGSIMSKENFISQNFDSKEFTLFDDEPIYHSHLTKSILPKGEYAIRYCKSFEEEIKLLPQFLLDIREQGYQIIGDYLCEVIHEQPSLEEQKRDMFIRMQVRIGKNNQKFLPKPFS